MCNPRSPMSVLSSRCPDPHLSLLMVQMGGKTDSRVNPLF